jgi:hypothetical protein
MWQPDSNQPHIHYTYIRAFSLATAHGLTCGIPAYNHASTSYNRTACGSAAYGVCDLSDIRSLLRPILTCDQTRHHLITPLRYYQCPAGVPGLIGMSHPEQCERMIMMRYAIILNGMTYADHCYAAGVGRSPPRHRATCLHRTSLPPHTPRRIAVARYFGVPAARPHR